MTKKLLARVAMIGAVAVCAVSVPVSAQSLGDVARKEAERRKAVKGPVTVVTNDNLRVLPTLPAKPADAAAGPGEPAAASTTAPGEAAASEKPPAPPDPTKDPEYWRRRMADAIQKRDRNLFLMDAVQTRINSLTNDFYARDDPWQRAAIGEERQRTIEELDRMKAEQELLEQRIADIEEEARRADIPPGWLR